MKNTFRTFVAVEMNEAVRTHAAELIGELGRAGAKVTWVQPHNMHLTLKFLDEVPSREIPGVCAAVAEAARGVPAFSLEVAGAGAFPRTSQPRTLWLGTGEGSEALIALHARLESALAKLGYRKEPRRFVPHLTIGRVRGTGPTLSALGQLLEEQQEFHAGQTEITALVVFSSQLRPEGPTYEVLSRAVLQ
jgi:RNA 2',3'-cyclic 3'-phosphodiesterase